MNITLESDPEFYDRLVKFWVANHKPGKFYMDGIYFQALQDNDALRFLRIGSPPHEQTSF